MNTEFNFYPFNLEKHRNGEPVEKWVYKNRCVLKNVLAPGLSFLCGYVVLAKKDIPKDWWGDYSAPGLQQLAIHGGLTFCEIEGSLDQETHYEEYVEALNSMKEEWSFQKRMDVREKLRKEYIAKCSKTDQGYVVFGFDCGHAFDESNPSLKDPNHVMMLVEQMHNQLVKFASLYQDYLEAGNNPVIKNVKRKAIMTDVLNEAELVTGTSFGHMIDLLAGKVDPDETSGEIT